MEPIKDLRLKLRLTTAQGIVMGPGRADLLSFIAATGSISAACREMKMSYRRGWTLVESMNNSFTAPLVETSKGGAEHGGARLTKLGEAVLVAYRKLETTTRAANAPLFDYFESVLVVPPVVKPR